MGHFRTLVLVLVVVTAAVVTTATDPARAEAVPVRAAAHGDYGRIVFNWPLPVLYEAVLEGGRLLVRFGRPIEADYQGVVRALRKYVRRAAPGADGRSVAFALTGEFELRHFPQGAAVVVDLVDRVPATPAPDPPKPGSKAAEPAPKAAPPRPSTPAGAADAVPAVRVRTGQHPDKTRIVFDWPRTVPYRLTREGGIATLTFDRRARVAVDRIRTRPPRYVGDARALLRGDGVVVTFAIPPSSRVRHFLSGPKVVLDVYAPAAGDRAGTLPPPTEQPAAAAEVSGAAAGGTTAPAAPAAKPVAARPQPLTAPAAPASPEPPADTLPAAAIPAEAAKAAESGARSPAPAGDQAAETPAPAGERAAADGTQPKALVPERTPAPPPVDPGAPAEPAAAPGAAGADSFGLRFDWDEPVAAAIFRRAGFLWIVFDKPTAQDVAALKAAGANAIRTVEQIPDPGATVLRLDTVAGVNPFPRREGLAWILDFRRQPLSAGTPVAVKAQPDSPSGPRVFVPVPEPGKAVGVTDPAVGDTIVVVPVIPLAHGVPRSYVYPEFRIVPSSQGVVILPAIDDLRVRPLRQGVELSSPDGLQISRVSPEAEANARFGSLRPLTRVLDLEAWALSEPLAFRARQRGLLGAAAASQGEAREQARLDLARLYVANGWGAEALGVLGMLGADRPEIMEEAEFRLLRGIAGFLMHRLDDAGAQFDHASLADNDEGVFWRAAALAGGGDRIKAARGLIRTGAITRPYPKPLRLPLGLLISETAIDVGDTKTAQHYLEVLDLDTPTPKEQSRIDYVEGRLRELVGDFDDAISAWESVMDGPYRPSRAAAAVARVELLLKLQRIGRPEAIEELETLRFAWRGDEFEFNLLRRLGDLYLAEEGYREALRTLRQAATHFRTHEEAAAVTQLMADTFSKLYLEGAADALQPITAIALYEEFKELTPAGPLGDEMIRKLADRLVAVDLLDRAARLLQGQVEFRLKGVEKTRVGAQLALIHTMALEYDKALAALEASATPGLPPELAQQRRHLRAKALVGMERVDDALALLEDDDSVDADLLRADVFWQRREWPNAAQTYRRLVRASGVSPGQPLDAAQTRYIFNLAISLTLSGNERAVARLRRDYGAPMAESELKDAFQLIASPAELGFIDHRTIGEKVSEAENFQNFMAAYRERLKKGELSAIN